MLAAGGTSSYPAAASRIGEVQLVQWADARRVAPGGAVRLQALPAGVLATRPQTPPQLPGDLPMRLEHVQPGDVVLARIKGGIVDGEVLEIAAGTVQFRPLCPAAGWRHASAREIVAHWRKTSRRSDRAVVDANRRRGRRASSFPSRECTRETHTGGGGVDERHVAPVRPGLAPADRGERTCGPLSRRALSGQRRGRALKRVCGPSRGRFAAGRLM